MALRSVKIWHQLMATGLFDSVCMHSVHTALVLWCSPVVTVATICVVTEVITFSGIVRLQVGCALIDQCWSCMTGHVMAIPCMLRPLPRHVMHSLAWHCLFACLWIYFTSVDQTARGYFKGNRRWEKGNWGREWSSKGQSWARWEVQREEKKD